jgi:hypothetical protein
LPLSLATVSRILSGLTPAILFPLIAIAFLHQGVTALVVIFEVSLLLLTVWYTYIRIGKNVRSGVQHQYISMPKRGILQGLQLGLFFLILVSTVFSGAYSLSFTFFALIAGLYFLLFIEAYYYDVKLHLFVAKLVIAQVLAYETIAFLYQNVFSVDSFRDFFIASSIIQHGGGVPQSYANNIWYNFSPMAPLTYAVQSVITGVPLSQAMIVSGFVFASLSTLAAGVMAEKIFKNKRISALTMLISSLVPFFWQFATYPLPEVFVLPMVLLTIVLLLTPYSNKGIFVTSLFSIVIVFTHGGMALMLIGIAFAVFGLTRNNRALQVAIISSVVFGAYSVLASVSGTDTGATTLVGFIDSLVRPITPNVGPTLGILSTQGVVLVLEIAQGFTGTEWWVFLGVVSWIGFLELLRRPQNRDFLSFVLVTLILFGIGVLLLLQPVALGQATRYLDLVSYVVLSIPASFALYMVSMNPFARRVAVPAIMILFIASSVCNVNVSPGLWQDVGAKSYASRFVTTVTISEVISQTYLNRYDNCYTVAANYYPSFVNLTGSCPSVRDYQISSETNYNGFGVASTVNGTSGAGYPKLAAPFVVLFSARIEEYGPAYFADPQAKLSGPATDVVFSDGTSFIGFVTG